MHPVDLEPTEIVRLPIRYVSSSPWRIVRPNRHSIAGLSLWFALPGGSRRASKGRVYIGFPLRRSPSCVQPSSCRHGEITCRFELLEWSTVWFFCLSRTYFSSLSRGRAPVQKRVCFSPLQMARGCVRTAAGARLPFAFATGMCVELDGGERRSHAKSDFVRSELSIFFVIRPHCSESNAIFLCDTQVSNIEDDVCVGLGSRIRKLVIHSRPYNQHPSASPPALAS